jgi:hypothetical protein
MVATLDFIHFPISFSRRSESGGSPLHHHHLTSSVSTPRCSPSLMCSVVSFCPNTLHVAEFHPLKIVFASVCLSQLLLEWPQFKAS